MNLDEAQRQRVTAWVLQGAKLSEIQNRLAEEFSIKLTYMEVRFLVDDLKLKLKDPEPPKVVEPPAAPKTAATAAALPGDEASPPPAGGKVSVSVDQITQPGAIVSGKVTFSDGQTADWYLDQTGPARRGAEKAGLQTFAGRRAGISTRPAAGSRQAGILNLEF